MATAASTSGNPFSADSLAGFSLLSLEHTQEKQVQDEFDLIALVINAGMIAVGFRLLHVGEGRNKLDCKISAEEPRPLPSSWNQNDNSYTFTYAHTQSSMQYLVKINRMLRKAVVSGMGDGDDKHHSFDLKPLDHVRPSVSYPLRLTTEDFTNEEDASNVGRFHDASQRFQHDIFQAPGRLADVGVLLKLKIIQKLAPGISKPGYEEQEAADDGDRAADGAMAGGRAEQQPRDPRPQGDLPDPARPNPYPHNDPLAMPSRPRRDPGELYPPGFTDEYEINRPPGRSPMGGPPMGIGERDLYPQGLGPRDPMRSFLGPGHAGPGGLGGLRGGGGMHPTFDDPMFGGRGEEGEAYDPMAPPGARFDPVGPGQRGGPRGNGFGGGAPPNPFGGFGSGDFI